MRSVKASRSSSYYSCVLVIVAFLFALPSQAQSFQVLYNFTGGFDGAIASSSLAIDNAGNLYGSTEGGGVGYGTIFELKKVNSSWVLVPKYAFTGTPDGRIPMYSVIFGPDGTLYGSTYNGGSSDFGTLFRLRPSPNPCHSALCTWNKSLIFQFSGSNGGSPVGGLVFDSNRDIIGTSYVGGGGCGSGTVYKLTTSGGSYSETVLHAYDCSIGGDGQWPMGGVTLDDHGNIYGVTSAGGQYGFGTIFRLVPSGSSWVEQILYSFTNGSDGNAPSGGLIFDHAGNLYGTTYKGGANGGGTVFELSPVGGGWTLNTLYSLSGFGGSYGSVVMDSGGNIYGATYQDGIYGAGSVFKLQHGTGGWSYESLHDFTSGRDGGTIVGGITLDSQGNIYGATQNGGTSFSGVIFKITP
jgi:uncharacterized repeat protein (TIGR03803 family)